MSDERKVLRAEDINKDTDIHEFGRFRREYVRHLKNPQTEAETLIYRRTHGKKTKEEYSELQEDVKKFMTSDASGEDKRAVRGYTESLWMICSAIRKGLH